MKMGFSINKPFLLACLLLMNIASHSQDTAAIKPYFDSLRLENFNDLFSARGLFKINIGFNSIYHFPEKEDSDLYRANKTLINQLPNSKNYEKYSQLAYALWNL